jgi:hypothetical protein
MIDDLPDEILFRTVMFLDGANGYKMQGRVNDDFGIYITSERETRRDPFFHTITMTGFGGIFDTLEELRDAIKAANREQADYIRQLESVNAPADEIAEAKKGGGNDNAA